MTNATGWLQDKEREALAEAMREMRDLRDRWVLRIIRLKRQQHDYAFRDNTPERVAKRTVNLAIKEMVEAYLREEV